MKRILCALLCVTLIFSFSACSKKDNGDDVTTTVVESANKDEKNSSKETTTEQTTKARKGSLKDKVKITLPLAVIDEKYRDDMDAYCADHGYIKAKIHKRAETVTITMKALTHELLLTEIGTKVIGSLYEIADSKDFSYINKIVSFDKQNFKSVVYSVDAKKYSKGSAASYMMAQSCLLYQLYTTDDDYRVDITVVDKKTGETIETVTYTDQGIINS